MTACCWWIESTDTGCCLSVEIYIWNTQRKILSYHLSINLFVRLHKWGEKNKTHLTCSETLLKQKCGEGRGSDVTRSVARQWRSEIQNDWISVQYFKLVYSEIKLHKSATKKIFNYSSCFLHIFFARLTEK
jgi:hypothetical protein